MESNSLLRSKDGVMVVSKHDEHLLRKEAGESALIGDLPINVDINCFKPIWAIRNPQPNRLLTVGAMSWPSNYEGVLWWLRDGYEYLQAICLDITYDIVGAQPPLSLQRLARQCAGVRLHGYIANVESLWASASALLVPVLIGEAAWLKILKAMALGVPVISTTVGCEGLAVQSGEHLLVADTPETLALACAMVLRDKKLALYLARNAYQLALEHYNARS
jgi:glycosyltransferase involved in cell wall biosynthesis